MALEELAAGKVVAQRYQLEKLLGEGGMGAVWLAVHVVTKKLVALKFLKANAASNPLHVRRFLREARAASAVRHPNVVAIHDVVELENGSPVMVMDFLVGESLAQRLERQKKIPLAELASLLLPVISAVGTAHSMGIVHRDIKPDNLFLEESVDGRIVPRILDFGIAKLSAVEGAAAETSTLTRTGSVMGTPYYMAPEQVFGERDIDQRADVWAFGVILYEALSGQRPIEGDNFGQLFKIIATGDIVPLARLLPNLPDAVSQLVDRMLSKERHKRPQDLREVFQVLGPYAKVSASSFEGPRLDLEALREQSVLAHAATQTPALTPAQFQEGRGATALLPETPHETAPTSDAFTRSSAHLPRQSSGLKWAGAAALALLLALGGAALMQKPSGPGAVAGVATAPTSSVALIPVAKPGAPMATTDAKPTPSVNAPELPRSATLVAPKRPEGRAPAPSAKLAQSVAPPATPAPAVEPAAKLPGGIAPKAPF
jgi:eukaryotic-like serine/threonine-protein kinase